MTDAEYRKIIRSIELSCDAVKNGADPMIALKQIKDKCRNALRAEQKGGG